MPIFVQKNVHSLKITMLSCPYFVRKTSLPSKTLRSHVISFKFFIKNPMLSWPYLVKKRTILPELHYILRATKVIGCPVFPMFYEKILAMMPIFFQKRPISKNQPVLMPIICQKDVHSLESTVL